VIRYKIIDAHVDSQLVLDEACGRASTCKDDEPDPACRLRFRHSGPTLTNYQYSYYSLALDSYLVSAVIIGVVLLTILSLVVCNE
jgi:hypothetical protein